MQCYTIDLLMEQAQGHYNYLSFATEQIADVFVETEGIKV